MRLLAGVSTVVLAFSAVAVAQATDLNPQHVGVQWDDPSFSSSDCEQLPAPGNVVWHFVLTQSPSDSTLLTASFDEYFFPGEAPDRAFGSTSFNLHWELETGRPATLHGASTDFDGSNLTLSHICVGDDAPQESVAPSSLPGAGGTPAGDNVSVSPGENGVPTPHTINFQSVTGAGTTTMTTSSTGPDLPSGYQLGSPPRFYDLETTATYGGLITVCLNYGGVTPAPDALLHFESGEWVDITTFLNPVSEYICGETTSLSPFVAVSVAPPTIVGFLQPLNDPISATNPMSVFKAGSTVPVKLSLRTADGAPISNADAAALADACAVRISLTRVAAGAPAVDEAASSATPNAGTCFRHTGGDQFTFNLGTKGLVKPATYEVTVSVYSPGQTVIASHTLAIGLR